MVPNVICHCQNLNEQHCTIFHLHMEFTLIDECWIKFCYVGKYTDIPQQEFRGMWQCVIWQVVPNTAEDHISFILKCHSSWTAWPLKIKAIQSFDTWWTTHLPTNPHIPENLNSYCYSLIITKSSCKAPSYTGTTSFHHCGNSYSRQTQMNKLTDHEK